MLKGIDTGNAHFQSAGEKLLMMTSQHGNTFPITGPLWGESTDHRWIPLTKGQ